MWWLQIFEKFGNMCLSETCKHAVYTLKSAGVVKTDDLNLIISSLVCDHTHKQCMYTECSACADKVMNVDDKIDMDKIVE